MTDSPWVVALANRGRVSVRKRQVTEERPRGHESINVVVESSVSDTRDGGVGLRSSQFFLGDILVRDGLVKK
jgi:hypothetical protein